MVTIWQRLNDARFGLANRLSDAIAALEWREPESFLDVRNHGELLVACDFAGSHSGPRYEAFAFLVGTTHQSHSWMGERMRVREEFLDDREMSYKGLNDAKRQRALAPFLNAADLFPGNLFVFMSQCVGKLRHGDVLAPPFNRRWAANGSLGFLRSPCLTSGAIRGIGWLELRFF
jgi:hypothetical protein